MYFFLSCLKLVETTSFNKIFWYKPVVRSQILQSSLIIADMIWKDCSDVDVNKM